MKSRNRKNILFVTGTRADFGKLRPLAEEARNQGMQIRFFVTGMHMLIKYGLTKEEVHAAFGGEDIVEFLNHRDGDPQDVVLAKTVLGFSDYLQAYPADLVVVHGDRVEALACSLVCATNYISCAHVEGGEVSGTIDEIFRHCNTKLASHHIVSSQQAAERVKNLGEETSRIFVIGSPELDVHSKPSGVSISEVRQHYGIPSEEYGVCLFHPVTSEQSQMANQARGLFQALRASNRHYVVILPNNDPGANVILDEIASLPRSRFRILPSMRFNYFSELMKNAKLIIGNSSAGVREAPFLGIPSINIGSRQTNRGLALSTHHCDAEDDMVLRDLINNLWGKRFATNTGYGEGSAAVKFGKILSDEDFWNVADQKVFVDREFPE